MWDVGVIRQLDSKKHGSRMHQLPGRLPRDLPDKVKFNEETFRRHYRDLPPLSGTGSDGYRYEYLQP